MRKIRFKPLAALAAVLVPLMAAAGVITHTATYDYSNLTLGTNTLGGVTYTTVHYDGLYNGGDPGMPSLPIDYLRFSVPYNATNFSVTASIGATVITSINHLVYPCQAPRMMNDTTPVTITLPDTSAYYTNTLYPSQRAWVVDEGFLAGENHIVTVAVMPIAYKHASSGMMRNSIRKSSSINLTLSYSISDSTSMRPIVREDSVLRQEGYQLTQSMVMNPSQVKPNSPSVFIPIDTLPNQSRGGGLDPFFPPHDSLVVDTTGIGTGWLNIFPKYLIITTQELSHSLRRLAALKRQKGYSVGIVTLDDIMNDPLANHGDIIKKADGTIYIPYGDEAGQVRQYLKYAYKWGTKYVLLAGNIPYRYTSKRMCEEDPTYHTLPSDLYYCDINGDWFIDSLDYNVELYVGRIIAKSENQIYNNTDKLLRYELNPGHGDRNYLKRAFYSRGYDQILSGELNNYVRPIFDLIFPDTTMLSESRNINDKSKYPSGEIIVDSINLKQYGFISLHHHGFPAGLLTYGLRNGSIRDKLRFLWAVDTIHTFAGYPPCQNDDPSTINGLNNMRNQWYPNVCYATACSTMPFDLMDGYENIPMNFGESYTTGKDYGGPAYIGNTRPSYTPSAGDLESIFGKKILNGYYNIGAANGLAKADKYLIAGKYQKDYVTVVQNLLGDPEFEIWTDIPEEYSNITVTRSNNSISVSGISGADSTIVAYTDNNGNAQTRVTSSATTFNYVSPNGTIMLYKHNYIPYIAPLFLQKAVISKSQYVIASDVTAGKSVDSIRTPGDVTVKSGVEYEIEASGTVTLDRGFKVEKGATFAVYPSSF